MLASIASGPAAASLASKPLPFQSRAVPKPMSSTSAAIKSGAAGARQAPASAAHPAVAARAAAETAEAATSSSNAPWQALGSLADLPAERYSAALLDQFGVLHDGQQPYPGAIEAVRHLAEDRGMRLLIISNSSRRAAGALKNLERLGFDPTWFVGAVTSGEVTHYHLTERPDAFWRQLGRRCLHFTWAARGAISLDGLGLEVTVDPQQADFVLAHGTEALGTPASSTEGGAPRPARLEEMQELLRACAARGLPMVVANPDVVTVDGTQLRPMPGWLAKKYGAMGGQVLLMGKPAPVIYRAALDMLQLPPEACLAVGDSLEHDIAGAAAAGVPSVFVAGGIHAEELGLERHEAAGATEAAAAVEGAAGLGRWRFSHARLAELCVEAGAQPTFTLAYLER